MCRLIFTLLALAACQRNSQLPLSLSEPPSRDVNVAPLRRLGDASIPKSAHLYLEVDADANRFNGQIRIEVELRETLHTIWLHQKGLTISSATFEQNGSFTPLQTLQDRIDNELLGLRSSSALPAGLGVVQIEFSGKFGEISGLFHQRNESEWYAYTDFEATDARAAFPCYDDPRFKIPWDIEIVVPDGDLAFANTPEIERRSMSSDSHTTLFRFATTRPLPSYLVAFAAGPFDVIEGIASKTPLRVIAPKGQAEAGRFVLDHTDQWMRFFETYLGMPMPYAKLDFIAVPEFGGAMENPGLVTFASAILLTGTGGSESDRRLAASVTLHELAHLWFGDFLTPHYWDDLWLSEAFATWLSDKAMAAWQPEKAREVLSVADKSTAFAIDYHLRGRRVRERITKRADIREAFDAITYRKGGAILTMLESWIGEMPMQLAVKRYVHAHPDGSVRGRDWIAAVMATTKRAEVAKFFGSFLDQTGIPLVSVTLQCSSAAIKATLSQSLYSPISTSRPAEQRLWSLPICLRYPGKNTTIRHCEFLEKESKTIRLDVSSCPSWILPNDRDSGYYHYDLKAEEYRTLRLHGDLDPRESLGLLYNIIAGFRSGALSVKESMSLFATFVPDGRMEVQTVLLSMLYELNRSLVGNTQKTAFSAMVRTWYQPKIQRLGLQSQPFDTEDDRRLRSLSLLVLGGLGEDRSLRAQLRDTVNAWLSNPQNVDLLLLNTWLQVAAIDADSELLMRYARMASTTKNRAYASILIGAQLMTRESASFSRAVNLAIDMRLRGPTMLPNLQLAMGRPELRSIVLERFQERRDHLLSGENRAEVFSRFADFYSAGCTKIEYRAAEAFFQPLNGEPFATEAILSTITGCIAFTQAQAPSAKRFFAGKN